MTRQEEERDVAVLRKDQMKLNFNALKYPHLARGGAALRATAAAQHAQATSLSKYPVCKD